MGHSPSARSANLLGKKCVLSVFPHTHGTEIERESHRHSLSVRRREQGNSVALIFIDTAWGCAGGGWWTGKITRSFALALTNIFTYAHLSKVISCGPHGRSKGKLIIHYPS